MVENAGETALPWHVFCRTLPEDFAFPMAWDPACSLRCGMEILDADGLRLQFTTFLPKAAPPELVRRHLSHFVIEFRNWTRAAFLASEGERP